MQRLEEELYLLRLKVLEMASLSQMATVSAMRAFVTKDLELAETVIEGDKIINALECEIDDMTLRLLALAQPWAKDLRFILAMVRVCLHIERVGDEAVNIARASKVIGKKGHPQLGSECVLGTIDQLSVQAGTMLRESISALQDNDVELARKVCDEDDLCDKLYLDVLTQTVDCMCNASPEADALTRYLLTAKSLERIGDLATNVAELVIFIVEGVNIKHGYMEHKKRT